MAQRLSNRTWVTCRPGSGARTAEVGSATELAAVFQRLKQVLDTDLPAEPTFREARNRIDRSFERRRRSHPAAMGAAVPARSRKRLFLMTGRLIYQN